MKLEHRNCEKSSKTGESCAVEAGIAMDGEKIPGEKCGYGGGENILFGFGDGRGARGSGMVLATLKSAFVV
jgi:hypothetical protein